MEFFEKFLVSRYLKEFQIICKDFKFKSCLKASKVHSESNDITIEFQSQSLRLTNQFSSIIFNISMTTLMLIADDRSRSGVFDFCHLSFDEKSY